MDIAVIYVKECSAYVPLQEFYLHLGLKFILRLFLYVTLVYVLISFSCMQLSSLQEFRLNLSRINLQGSEEAGETKCNQHFSPGFGSLVLNLIMLDFVPKFKCLKNHCFEISDK